MLNNLNPAFIMELTATPRSSSNIISYVDARELKKENMVKLPVVVFNRNSRQTVIQDAIQLRGNIEKQALTEQAAGGKYIRPIVLFQAQPKINEGSDTFDKIKSLLIEMGIPQEQIAVKTSKVDDIGNTDLMSPSCEIRYIITVNALKEGWDCPFAYILASLANKNSKVDVEQILGRILRQPYVCQHAAPLLNTSYVLTCSNDFCFALDSIVAGLNKSGFSKRDYRVAEELPVTEESEPQSEPKQMSLTLEEEQSDDSSDSFDDVNPQEIGQIISGGFANGEGDASDVNIGVAAMIESAVAQSEQYNAEINNARDEGFVGGELGDMLIQNTVQEQYLDEVKELRVPRRSIHAR